MKNLYNIWNELIPNIDEIFNDIKTISIDTLPNFAFDYIFMPSPIRNGGVDYLPIDANISKVCKKINNSGNKIKVSTIESGLYILQDLKNDYQYIGESKYILSRIKQHFCRTDYHSANLVYMMLKHGKSKDEIIALKESFKEQCKNLQEKMRKEWKITFIPFNNYDPYIIHFYEIYFSCKLHSLYNTYKTH
ncbi:MAG: GIY-YIG nuclease family protein [Brevinematales bacterium]|nr:GIY-YIG nuclease family protein [Brevinematales bacterium]